jgi:HlyD family secretion protein
VTGLVGLIGAYIAWPEPSKPSENYRVATIERGDLIATVSATGNLHPVVSVQVGTQVSGQIKEIFVDYNSPVRKGQLIARIDPQAFALRVEQAMADLAASRSNVLVHRASLASVHAEIARQR